MFEVAAEFVRHNIALGHLKPGLVLQESALSERLDMSRATLKRALEIVESEGLIERFSGRGFVVSGAGAKPQREDLRQIALDHSSLDDSVGKPSWLRVYDDVAFHVTRCPVFGRYRVFEAQMAEEYGVSRTIIRDVLGRLQERGLVQKSKTSRWVVEPLTSRKIKDKYELRNILEVAALQSAKLPLQDIQKLISEIDSLSKQDQVSEDQWFALDRKFFELVVLTTPNEDLAEYASSNRIALEACQAALFSLGLPPDKQSLQELRQVLELALSGSISAATSMLSTHLAKASARTIAQLKITAIIAPPPDFPSYLQFS
ncbi:GntR family transcriptional regulator [Celeribacter litoreus]|uniref:GntR family transcriptional regulator n=1 Tax=Celeribacter litoreus TaxID=2876714 RepID=UPI001CCF5D18|nr:GntR family transcriptional regulator [Celeribacter litoreus]